MHTDKIDDSRMPSSKQSERSKGLVSDTIRHPSGSRQVAIAGDGGECKSTTVNRLDSSL